VPAQGHKPICRPIFTLSIFLRGTSSSEAEDTNLNSFGPTQPGIEPRSTDEADALTT